MKNPVTLAVLLILTSALDFVQAAATAQEDKHVEEEIRRLNAEEADAFLHKDPQAMARLWSDDFVVKNPLNKLVSKQQVLGMVESGFLVIPSFDREIEYLQVYGDIVIVAGGETVVWGGKMTSAGKTEHLRFTAVWMKQAGRWQEIARHANIVPPQQPAVPAEVSAGSFSFQQFRPAIHSTVSTFSGNARPAVCRFPRRLRRWRG
jgi:uncharacterized protein (TIGR02246 family)